MARTVYFGGPILTMEEPLYAQALVEENGIIRYVGDRETALKLAGPQARKVDLEGRTLMPAFLDPHSHFMACANAMLQVQLRESADQEEICARLSQFVQQEQLQRGEWVRGTGYDQNELAQGCPPDRWMLDRACPDHPVVIQHASGHVGVFNSRALELLGVDENTPCPSGGVMEKDAQGRLTGYMEENAFLGLLQKVPMPDLEDLMDALARAQDRYASYGIATVQEGMFMDGMLPLYQAMLERKLLKVDVVAYADPRDCQNIMVQFGDRVGRYKDHVKIGGDKIFLDGSPQGRTAWMRQPYEGERDYRGYPALTDEQVYERLKSASERGVQILAHCNGDGAAEQYLSVMERLERETGRRLRRPVMIHAQLVGRDQLPRLKALGMIPSFFVAHVYHWGEVHVKNFGLERAEHISPAGTACALELPFTFHQDSPVIPPNMMETVWCAVNRRTKNGRVLGEGEKISTLEALKAVTRYAAYQYFEEDRKGSLAEGKAADFVILGQDPLAVDPMELRNIPVLETIKDGRTIWFCGRKDENT